MESKERILEKNNVCVCSANKHIADLETRICFMDCGKRQDLTKEQIEKVLIKSKIKRVSNCQISDELFSKEADKLTNFMFNDLGMDIVNKMYECGGMPVSPFVMYVNDDKY